MMQSGIILILALATVSLASGLTPNDVALIADIKQSAKQTKLVLIQQSLRSIREIAESMIAANAVSARERRNLEEFIQRTSAKLRLPTLGESAIEETLDDLKAIIGFAELSEEEGKARMTQYTNGKYAIIIEKAAQQFNREIQLFAYITNPKIRQLSASAQQSEQRLISAFNNLAYAGLVRIEQSFSDFLELIERY
ncbi:hypothetical protein AWZ03_012982 [Drosophila navojoa]|uniref:Protein TsetseEP domain-containing protein n=1 Tax=Drosophila navojoa TaxID=7232 RepID=A0A484AYE2_DRONA|nr:hypothetical protein AWZ03_012982 [Drosophila navojoa]